MTQRFLNNLKRNLIIKSVRNDDFVFVCFTKNINNVEKLLIDIDDQNVYETSYTRYKNYFTSTRSHEESTFGR